MTSSLDFNIPDGLECVEEYQVRDEHAAQHIGTGEIKVISTPSMILFMERTALKCVQRHLPEDYTTVGTYVEVRHLNPAPVNSVIRVNAKLIGKEGRRLIFEVKAFYKDTLIGEGRHERFIVNREKFLDKIRRLIENR